MSARRLLLDTHVFLWWRAGGERIRASVQSAVMEADLVYVSAASAWEAAVKSGLGKLDLPESFEAGVVDSGFDRLLVSFAHAAAVQSLPRHHRGPFDRLLVAQAQVEQLVLVTADRRLAAYPVEIKWA